MSISSRINEIEQHITNAYDGLEDIGADLTNIDKNINNISTVLDNIWNVLPKVTASDVEEASLDGTKQGRIEIGLNGNIGQDSYNGYNIINIADVSTTVSGVTITSTGTKFKLNGTANANINLEISPIIETIINGTYTLSLTYLAGSKSGGNNFSIRDVSTSNSLSYVNFGTSNASRTTEYTNNSIKYKIYADSGSVFDNYEFEIQLEAGSTVHDYEPYCGRYSSPKSFL